MSISALFEEFASVGVGDLIYDELLLTVRLVVVGRHYPPAYSPTGRWDEDAYVALAHDWAMTKLLRLGHLEHLLLTNETVRGFRKGLQLSFVQFLISQKKRTALDNLFARTTGILSADERFRCFIESPRKSDRYWGLASWEWPEPYAGSEAALIATGLRLQGIRVIRYRTDAKKLSPIISDRGLADLLMQLLRSTNALLNLGQFVTVFRYRFDLLQAPEESTRELLDSEDIAPLGQRVQEGSGVSVEEQVLLDEAAFWVLQTMPTRQQRVLLEYAYPDATLESIAHRVGCSKSTVDNELHRALQLLRNETETYEEARAIYERVLTLLSDGG